MEGDWIPLKEDSSFEILQLLDDDEIPFEKIRNPKDEIEYFVTEKKDDDNNICKWTNGDTHPIIECNRIAEKEDNDNNICKWTNDYTHPIIECDGIAETKDDDNNICKWTNDDTHPIIEYNGIASSNFSPLAVKSTIDPVTLYRMDVKEIGNIGCYYPVCSSDHDKVMTSYGFKSSGTNSSIPLNSEAMHKPKEKIETKADRPYEILVISTGEFNCCQVEEQCVPKGFSNHGNNESTKEEHSSWVSRSEQRNEAQSGSIVCEEAAEDYKTPDFLTSATCDRKICGFVDNGIQFCSWLRSRKCVQRFVKKAKASFKSIASTVELEINQILGSENPLRLSIISDGLSAQAIEEAFTEVFRGHALASVISVDLDTIPALPIGNLAGLQAAEMKINYARQSNLVLESSVAISTSVLLHEAVSQRWQMTTVICLADPNLALNLHNFTATTPIPNQYVMEAERQTLPNYHLRDYGLAVDIKQAIDAVTKMTSEDAQEFLTGVTYYSTLKSAALVLAGIYKKYAIKCT